MTGQGFKFDAIVVGGGHNGMVAAFYLARSGQKVALVERRAGLGGPAGTVEYFPGYRSAITNSPGSLEPKIVADMRLNDHGLRWKKPDPAVVMPFGDGRFFVGWRDQARTRAGIAKTFSAHDAEAYPRVFAFFDDFARRLGISLFEKPPTLRELAGRLATPQDEADFSTIFFDSIRNFLEPRLKTDELKTAIAMLATGGAAGPSTPGTPLALLQRPLSLHSSAASGLHDPRNQPMRGSTGLPMGGMGAIVDAMETALLKEGVTILKAAPVARIVVRPDGQATGVALADGTELDASIVVSSLDPRITMLKLVEPTLVPSGIREALQSIPKGAGTFKVVLAVDEPPLLKGAPAEDAEAFSSCQIRIASSMAYLEKCHEDFLARRWTDSPRLLGLIPTFNDPTQAPEGRHLISFNSWYYPDSLDGTTWAAEKDKAGKRIVEILTEHIPSLARSIVAERFYSPEDLEEEYGLIGGNFSHFDMTPAHMFGFRPVPGLSDYRTSVRGLYLTGAGVWPGGTVTGIPGHNTAHAVLEDLADGLTSRETLAKFDASQPG